MDHGQTPDKVAAGGPGANRHVQDVIRRAEHELRQLIEERAEVTKRIGTVKQTIVGLANLFGDGILDAALSDMVDRKGTPSCFCVIASIISIVGVKVFILFFCWHN